MVSLLSSPSMDPSSPHLPLHPVSPERTNRQPLSAAANRAAGEADLQKPFPRLQSTTSRGSDVQGKVAQFNNLSRDNTSRRHENEAARKRAEMGREEAEGEVRSLRQQLEDSQAQTTKVCQRLETIMEDKRRVELEREKVKSVYEKEIRRARKEAFKASSDNIKWKEECKAVRTALNTTRDELDAERLKVEAHQQEVHTARCRVVDLEDDLERSRQHTSQLEEERAALKTSLKEEEVARIAAEGKIALPPPSHPDELASPSRKPPRQEHLGASMMQQRRNHREDAHRVMEAPGTVSRWQLDHERRMRLKAEELVDFMGLQCQIKQCACRLAERRGKNFVHDQQFDHIVQQTLALSVVRRGRARTPLQAESATPFIRRPPEEATEALIDFSPIRPTYRAGQLFEPGQRRTPLSPTLLQPTPPAIAPSPPASPARSPPLFSPGHSRAPSPPDTPMAPQKAEDDTLAAIEAAPCTPRPVSSPPVPRIWIGQTTPLIRSQTTITRVPLADEAAADPPHQSDKAPSGSHAAKLDTAFPYSPGTTKTREEALQAIERWRRGRSRSVVVNGTPRKPLVAAIKRDCSAPVGQSNLQQSDASIQGG